MEVNTEIMGTAMQKIMADVRVQISMVHRLQGPM